jgi:hypothetical protein
VAVYPDALATSADYLTWINDTGGTAPANIDQVLRSCTGLVLDAVKLACYDTDDSGVATDPDVKQAMQDATCIQAAAWVALKIDPLTGGVLTSSVKGMKKIGTAQVEFADTAAAVAARKAAYEGLVPDADRKLRLNNLIGFAPRRAR